MKWVETDKLQTGGGLSANPYWPCGPCKTPIRWQFVAHWYYKNVCEQVGAVLLENQQFAGIIIVISVDAFNIFIKLFYFTLFI